jgi:hypothetical protein
VANEYATVADLREQLGDTSSRGSSATLQRLLTVASRDVDRYTGRKFWLDPVATARSFDVPSAPDDGMLLIDDIGSRTGLLVGAGLDGVTFDSIDAGEYELHPLNSDLTDTDAYAWWWIGESAAVWNGGYGSWLWNRRVRITARWGWSAPPAAVVEATLLRAVSLYKRKDAPFGVAGFDGYGVVRLRTDPDFAGLLAPYRRAVGIA